MPQAAVAAIGTFLVGAGVAAFAGVIKLFAYVALAYLLNRASKALEPKRRGAGLGSGAEANYFDSGASVRIVYGQVRVGGMETIPPITTNAPGSSNNEDLHKVLTIAGHEVDSYISTHFDAVTIANTYLAPMAFTTSDGMVNSPGPYAHKAFIRRYRGTSTDSADQILIQANSGMFTNFRGRGIAKLAITFRFQQDLYKGVPIVTTTLRGKRCYDPRLDVSPGASPTNASYIAWTQNPALCLCDYLMSDLGGSYAGADIDWDTVVTAANYCEGTVNIPNALTQQRYTCNGVLYATEEFTENVKALVDSMLGRVIFRDGKWRIFAGSWQTPTFTIQKSDWISGLSIRFEQGKRRRFNQMRTWFVDADREWQRVESTPRTNATYKTADGEELIDAETEQLMCTNQYEAQRKGEFLLRQSRNQITVSGRLPPRFQDIALWDTGTIVFDHLGWSSKTFRAVGIDMNPDGSMDCVFAEEQSSDWTDLSAGEYNAPSAAVLPAVNVTNPSEPRSFSVTQQINGTLLFQWQRPIVQPYNTRFQVIRSTNSANAAVGTVVWEGDGTASPLPLVMPTSPHWYYMRAFVEAINSAGVSVGWYSQYTPNTFGILGLPRLEADQTLQNRLCGDAEFSFGASTSLWQSGNLTGEDKVNNISSLSLTSYHATGGQFGGYMNLQKRPSVVHSFTFHFPAFFSVNLNNSLGFPYNGGPFAVEYSVRFRVNSRPAQDSLGGTNFRLATVIRWSTPASAHTATGMAAPSALVLVSSADSPIGQWTTIRRVAVAEPIDVDSASQHYAFVAAYFVGSGSVDFDYIDANALGFVNYPVQSINRFNPSLYEYKSMYNIYVTSPANTIAFPATDRPFQDWRKFAIGRKFTVSKLHTANAAYINPASGMNLYLAGRASVGTVTMVASLPARAIIENINGVDYFVSGDGLI